MLVGLYEQHANYLLDYRSISMKEASVLSGKA